MKRDHSVLSALLWAASAPLLAAQSEPAAPLPITGEARPELAALDRLMVDFMQRMAIPGGALAVSRGGRLVYDRGFGHADREAGTPVEPGALFRIASISKPITAVAILQLVERGQLDLDDAVVDILEPRPFASDELADPRFAEVTIRHLLQHSGGWDRDKSFDPMFRSRAIAEAAGRDGPAEPDDIIRYMAGMPLDFDPGERYAYSNFGYCLLGRVIEKVTGARYEAFVQRSVLRKVGIRDMHIGASVIEGRRRNEVRYYAPARRRGAEPVFPKDASKGFSPTYGAFYLEAMDSHGAWIASARDLLRFACDFDDPARSKLLEAESIATMFALPRLAANGDEVPRSYYACGWLVGSDGTQRHGGSLPGTATSLVRNDSGVHYALLFNARHDGDGERFSTGGLEKRLREALDAVEEWPRGDLFRR